MKKKIVRKKRKGNHSGSTHAIDVRIPFVSHQISYLLVLHTGKQFEASSRSVITTDEAGETLAALLIVCGT
jgi:hypothetical protein